MKILEDKKIVLENTLFCESDEKKLKIEKNHARITQFITYSKSGIALRIVDDDLFRKLFNANEYSVKEFMVIILF